MITTNEPETAGEVIARIRATKAKFSALHDAGKRMAQEREQAQRKRMVEPPKQKMVVSADLWKAYFEQCEAKRIADQKRAEELNEGFDNDPMPHVKLHRPSARQLSAPQYLRRIVNWVAKRCRLRPEDIYGESRAAHVIQARHLAMQIAGKCNRLKCMSCAEIARRFNRDHTTILYIWGKAPSMRNSGRGTRIRR